jgi:hypothetical protein
MRKSLILIISIILIFASLSFGFYLHVGQDKSEVITAIGQPNYSDLSVDSVNGKIERCQWGSERAGTMVVIYFKNGKVVRFETKGKVN